MKNNIIHTESAKNYGASPWTFKQRAGMLLWGFVWTFFCQWTPKHLNAWRLFILRCFGAKIHGRPFVHQRARIQIPWNLTLYDRACLGDGSVIYSLDYIEIGARAIIAQEAYLCTGSHDLKHPNKPLITAGIKIGENAFVGARSFILPGIEIGDSSVVGACAVVTKNVGQNDRVAGNPARSLSKSDNT